MLPKRSTIVHVFSKEFFPFFLSVQIKTSDNKSQNTPLTQACSLESTLSLVEAAAPAQAAQPRLKQIKVDTAFMIDASRLVQVLHQISHTYTHTHTHTRKRSSKNPSQNEKSHTSRQQQQLHQRTLIYLNTFLLLLRSSKWIATFGRLRWCLLSTKQNELENCSHGDSLVCSSCGFEIVFTLTDQTFSFVALLLCVFFLFAQANANSLSKE